MLLELQKRLKPTDQLRELDLSARYQRIRRRIPRKSLNKPRIVIESPIVAVDFEQGRGGNGWSSGRGK